MTEDLPIKPSTPYAVTLGIGAVMIGPIFLAHLSFGFFMDWAGNQQGEGYEYHLLAIGSAVALIIRGGGTWSPDYFLFRKQPQ